MRFSLGKTFSDVIFVLANNKTKIFWRIEGQANSLRFWFVLSQVGLTLIYIVWCLKKMTV